MFRCVAHRSASRIDTQTVWNAVLALAPSRVFLSFSLTAACCATTICIYIYVYIYKYIYYIKRSMCIYNKMKIRGKTQLMNSLVVEHYVGPPYVVGRYVQHVNSSVFLRLPSQLVVVPWLETTNTTNINILLVSHASACVIRSRWIYEM